MMSAEKSGKNSIKLVVCDLDGTLLNSEKQITTPSLAAIAETRRRGIRFSVCTGRIPTMAQYYLEQLALDIPVITVNGAILWERSGRAVLKGTRLDRAEAVKIMRFCRDVGADHCALTLKGCWFSDNSVCVDRFRHYNEIAAKYGGDEIPIWRFDSEFACMDGIDCYKLLAYRLEAGQLRQIKDFIERLNKTDCTSSDPGMLDISAQGVSKGAGLQQLMEYLRVRPDEVCAMGDFENDISMLKNCAYPVAMKNACAEVKATARFITRDNDHDGVAYALREYVWKQ
jgi:Cof subfamily protein (haloacid dehalogenase superfamily)